MEKAQIDELIDLLRKYELSIATLYDTFGALLPSSQKAWTVFANEERLHAKWISTLQAHMGTEKVSFEQTRFTIQSTRSAIDYIERQTENIKKTRPELKKILAVAIDIEKSLFDSAFFKVFKLSGPKALQIQSKLVKATKNHLERLIKWQADEKK